MPVRSPRAVYLIKGAVSNVDDVPNVIDNLPGNTEVKTFKPIYCKMKVAIGDYFGLVALKSDDLAFQGTFAGNGLNKGSKYFKNIGGFKEDSFKLYAKTTFDISQYVYDEATKTTTKVNKNFSTISIGFPKGVSVNELLAWLTTLTNSANVLAVSTPNGRRINL